MGKSTIIYVIGLSLIVGLTLTTVNRTSLDSMDTYATYFGRTMAHNIALAAANLGANKVLFTPGYSTALSGSFSGGSYSVAFNDTGTGSSYAKFMTVVSQYSAGGENMRDTVKAVFSRVGFSRYGWFTEQERNGYVSASGTNGPYFGASDYKITGDSVFGYAHTNSKFNLAGTPYFSKKVTAMNAPTTMTLFGVYAPIFIEGYEWGISIARPPSNLTYLKSISNSGSPLAGLMTGNDVSMEFFSGGTVRVRIPPSTGALKDTTLPVSSLSSTKVIGVIGGDLRVKGTYQGQYTLAAFSGASGPSTNKGNVWVDGSIVAATNPRTNPSSTDKLGLVAERMGYITKDNTRNMSSVLNVQAAIYCHNGEFTAEDFWSIPKSGRVNLYGSITQKTAGSLGVFSSSSGLLNGFFYSIRHDARFLEDGPPEFPFSPKYRLVAWWEN